VADKAAQSEQLVQKPAYPAARYRLRRRVLAGAAERIIPVRPTR